MRLADPRSACHGRILLDWLFRSVDSAATVATEPGGKARPRVCVEDERAVGGGFGIAQRDGGVDVGEFDAVVAAAGVTAAAAFAPHCRREVHCGHHVLPLISRRGRWPVASTVSPNLSVTVSGCATGRIPV